MALYYPTTSNFIQKTLNALLSAGVTASATLNNVTSIQNKLGVMIIDRVDANGTETPDAVEVISFEGTSGSTVTTLVRALGGTTDSAHQVGAIVEFGPDIIWAQGLIDAMLNVVDTTGALDTTKVVDLTTAQTLTNKRLTSPKLNENVALTSTATELNLLTGVTALVTGSSTTTLTNKRVEPRIVSTTSYTTDTGSSLSVATADEFVVTAQAGALLFNAPGGTPVEGQKLVIRIKDNGTARALTWNAVFRAMGTALPSTTVLSKTLYLGFIYNFTDTKWDLVASAQEA